MADPTKDDATIGSFSSCATVIMSNEEVVPPFTPEEFRSRVEAVYNSYTGNPTGAADIVDRVFMRRTADLPHDVSAAVRSLRRFLRVHEANPLSALREIINTVREEQTGRHADVEEIAVVRSDNEPLSDLSSAPANNPPRRRAVAVAAAAAAADHHDEVPHAQGGEQVQANASTNNDLSGQVALSGSRSWAGDFSRPSGYDSSSMSSLPAAVGADRLNPDVNAPPLAINASAVLLSDVDGTETYSGGIRPSDSGEEDGPKKKRSNPYSCSSATTDVEGGEEMKKRRGQ